MNCKPALSGTANRDPAAIASIQAVLRTSMRPPPELSRWQWAEANIVVPRRAGTWSPGPLRTDLSPWMRGILDALADPTVATVVIRKGAQVSVTLTMLIDMLYNIVNDPDPILYMMPTKELAEDLNRARFLPMLEDSPTCAAMLTTDRHDVRKDHVQLVGTFVRFIGSNSPAQAASFAHRFLYLDELDKYQERLGDREGNAINLAFARAKTYWNRKRVMASTPTTAQGAITRYFEQGDKRLYYVPCPHCGHMQPLEWERVRFDSALAPRDAGAAAYYECANPACGGRMTDQHKHAACNAGEWRATCAPERTGYASFDLPGLYSLSDECGFGALAEKFLSVKDRADELREFINQDLGRPFEEPARAAVRGHEVYAIRDLDAAEYEGRTARGMIPTAEPSIVAVTTDCQGTHLVWATWAIARWDIWLIDHGFAATVADFDADVTARTYTDAAGRARGVYCALIDTGHRTLELYDYALSRPRFVVPIKGEGGQITSQTEPIRAQIIGTYPSGQKMPHGEGLTLRHIHPRFFKDRLADAIAASAEVDASGARQRREALQGGPLRLHFHADIDAGFVSQITGEVLRELPPDRRGNVATVWKRIRQNDFFDCAQYAMALHYMLIPQLDAALAASAGRQDDAPEASGAGGVDPSVWYPDDAAGRPRDAWDDA